MKERFYDLSFEMLVDGTIRLEQRDYCGESVLVDLHPVQLEHIARSVLPSASDGRIATLERRLCWLRDRFEETRVAAPADMYDRCPEAFEFDAWIQASIDVAIEFCADLESQSAPVEYPSPQDTHRHLEAIAPVHSADRCQLDLAGL